MIKAIQRWAQRALGLSGPGVIEAWEEAGLLRRSESGVRVTTTRALGHAPLFRGINLLANCPMRLPLHVYQDTPDNSHRRATEHAAYPLLRRKPNRWMTAATFKRLLTFHAVFYGNGYARIVRNGRGEPVALIPLDPLQTKPIQADGAVWYKLSETQRIIADDVLHLKGLSHDGLLGLSVIELMADALGLGLAAREFAGKFFRDGAQAKGILGITGLTNDQAPGFQDQINKLTGPDSAHKLAIISGEPKLQTLGIDPEKAQLIQVRMFEDTKTVSNILGLPPHLLGDDAKSSYASLEQENQSLLSNSYDPILVTWEDECNAKLLGDDDSYFCEYNRQALLRTDTATRYEAYMKGRNGGWLSVNDVRRAENLPSIGPEGDIYLSPSNMVPADQLDDPPEPEPEPDAEPDAEPQGETEEAVRAAIDDRLQRIAKLPEEVRAVKAAESLDPLFKVWHTLTGQLPTLNAETLTVHYE